MAKEERGIKNMLQKFVPKEVVDRILHQESMKEFSHGRAKDCDLVEHRHTSLFYFFVNLLVHKGDFSAEQLFFDNGELGLATSWNSG
nr:hypothetical protein [Desulfobacterales bacterium]